MIRDMHRLTLSMEQMERVMLALEDLRQSVLPRDPQLFATFAEAPLDDLQRLRKEINNLVLELRSAD